MEKKTQYILLEKMTEKELLMAIAYYQKRAALNLVFVTCFIVVSSFVSALAYFALTDRMQKATEKVAFEQRLLEQYRE